MRNKHLIPNDVDKQTFKKLARYFYTLSFSYTLQYDNDTVYFAHSYPYTYQENLRPFLEKIAQNSDYNKFLRMGNLCYSFARNEVKMITITENVKYYRNSNEELSWMAKSQAARRIIRLKSKTKKSIFGQIQRKTK